MPAYIAVNRDLLGAPISQKMWEDGPFQHLCVQPIATKGKTFIALAKQIMQANGDIIENAPKGSDFDFYSNSKKVKVTGSMISATGRFTFNQIKPEYDWEELVMLTLYPNGDAKLYCTSKWEAVKSKLFKSQHAGKDFTLLFSNTISALPPHWHKSKYDTNIIST